MMKPTINIVIPMAGNGSRFASAGYEKPKPFIEVNGKTMIERVIENLQYPGAKFFLIGRKDHIEREKDIVERITSRYSATFIGIENTTEGTACTVLFAKRFIDNEIPLLIANSDQLVDINIADFVDYSIRNQYDGSILCFKDSERNPKWSFAEIDSDGLVLRVKEKEVISPYATVGIYLFGNGSSFVNYAIDMIIRNERVNNEFYTCPVYNYAISEGSKIGIYLIDFNQMNGLGTPEDLNKYLSKN
ncbi:glycosyltransferase family 2 protein [Desertivirga xinjiangensis]|uniref:glycosyltransferase family 2 protein n=1 Tax=Desertivirga xinjiangensis TaxID=539206 RepID=UPI00210DCE5D|nr:glycosyltransferase family 2 protein [Pedobacter xinjiangensis]